MTSIHINKLIPGGQALATMPDGKKIFLWNALPGETVTDYTVTKKKSHYTEATATSIENPSPYRIAPLDDCYLSTSPWQIMTYDYELQQKRELLTEQFRQFGINLGTGVNLPITDNNYLHYRNKMEYSLYWDNDTEQISLAFHPRGSHRKQPITSSHLERPEIWSRATEIVSELNSSHAEARKYQSLLLRCSQDGTVSGGLLENCQPHPIFANLTDTILGHPYSYSPNGFFQINLPVYELALTEIAKHIHTDKVLDLYSGVGTIGLSVARDKQLTLVECNKAAFGELVENCKNAGSRRENAKTSRENILSEPVFDNISQEQNPERSEIKDFVPDEHVVKNTQARREAFSREDLAFSPAPNPILANSEDCLDYISPDQTVILDPPRAGCDEKLITRLLEVTPDTIIYLSCNPATQARDISLLLGKYHITHQSSYNFFPRTPHLENLIILEK